MPKKYVIHIIGNSCTGKSALEKMLKQKLVGSYTVSSDYQKWQLSGYHRDKDSDTVKEITIGLLKAVCKIGLPILFVNRITTEKTYDDCMEFARDQGYIFVSVELTAPKDVLLERFRTRVKKALLEKSTRISVTDENVFLTNLEKPFFIPEDAHSFDTSIMTAEEISEQVMGLLNLE